MMKIASLKTAICGFFMALADSVPGVSGGTVAFFAGAKVFSERKRRER